MTKKHLLRGAIALSIGLLFPSLGNFTPATAANSVDDASSLWVVVNKARPLSPLKYKPENLAVVSGAGLNINPYGKKLNKNAAYALVQVAKAMNRAGKGKLVIQSAYRSFSEQVAVHDRMVSKYGLKKGESYAARPGFSEHQTGLAVDVSARSQGCQIRDCFGGTKAGAWLAKNAYKYGFVLRYPKGFTSITGYQFEPWHFRYVGKELALAMHNEKIHTLEQYFKLPAAPKYP